MHLAVEEVTKVEERDGFSVVVVENHKGRAEKMLKWPIEPGAIEQAKAEVLAFARSADLPGGGA